VKGASGREAVLGKQTQTKINKQTST